MMNGRRVALVLGLVPLLAAPTIASACSKGGFPAQRNATTAHFIALPTRDTVFTGAGTVRYGVRGGHSQEARARTIYGQVMRVERLSGIAAAKLRRPVERVVVVPWDYTADCTPVAWGGSAAWASDNARGLFVAKLRDSAHWAGGLPTFDVFAPELLPYPQQIHRQRRSRLAHPDSILAMDLVFDLIDLLPSSDRESLTAATEVTQLFAWARANPGLVEHYPVNLFLTSARSLIMRQRLRTVHPPVVGTYELTATLGDGVARRFFARTRARPITEWHADGSVRRRESDPTVIPQLEGYYILTAVAETLDGLPTTCSGRDERREAYIGLVDPPPDSMRAEGAWSGSLEVALAQRALPEDSALRSFDMELFRSAAPREATRMPARFSREPDGSIHVTQTLRLDNGRTLTMSGRHLSTTVVECDW